MNVSKITLEGTIKTARKRSCKDNKPRYVILDGRGDCLISKNPPTFAHDHYFVDRNYIELRPV